MADRVLPGPVDESTCISEAVCIHTRKIYDSCKDSDCVEDLRVYPLRSSVPYIESAFSVRAKSAELLCANVDVDEICFNRGYYTVDVTYFYRVTGETFPGGNTVSGLAVFDKRVLLYGSEGGAKVYASDECAESCCSASQPVAVVEAVDPIALRMKLVDCHGGCCPLLPSPEVPAGIIALLGEDVELSPRDKSLTVTVGQFSIIRLERDTQLVIPVYDYCLPDKECPGGCEDDPCALFSRIDFPVDEFFPPDSCDNPTDYRDIARC